MALYDRDTLKYWETRYPISTQKIFDIGFLPELWPDEKRVLANVNLRFPLPDEENFGGNPLAFYSYPNRLEVVMPIMSLKFLDDLSTAYAWLTLNDYSLETVTDYVSMLKYSKPASFPGGRYPEPLIALRIPDDALEDAQVDSLALGLFNTARAFILAHELGHLYHCYPECERRVSLAEAKSNERKADDFAVDLMSRVPTIPAGAVLVFMAMAHLEPNRWDYPNRSIWETYLKQVATHPLTPERLHALAAGLQDKARYFALGQPDYAVGLEAVVSIAINIEEIAKKLEDPDVQESIGIRGRTSDLDSLAPRRP